MPKLSVVIATRNEERIIEKCLESVKWVDEIVVVDDCSTDATIEIVKKYTEKVFINNSNGSFHKNKNLAIEKASGEWILSLDADEIIPPELTEEIKNVIKDSNMLGYYLNRKNYFIGKWIRGCGWYPDYIIRLFKKGVTKWPLDIHDIPKINEKNKVAYLENNFIHYSYFTLNQYFDKFNRYTTRLANEESEKNIKINNKNCLLYFFIKPLLWFIKKYFFQYGWRDRFHGFFISVSSGLVVFTTYAKLWEMQRNEKK